MGPEPHSPALRANAAGDPDADLEILEKTSAVTMLRRQKHWKNIHSAGRDLAICLPVAAALVYCLINGLIPAGFGFLLIVLIPYAIGSFIRLGNEAFGFIHVSHSLLTEPQDFSVPESEAVPVPRMSQPLTLGDDPNYAALLSQKRQRQRELSFAAALTAAIFAAVPIIGRFGPAGGGDHPPNLFVIFSYLSPCWLIPLLLRYEVAWRKVRDVRFLYDRLTGESGLPPLTMLRMGVRDRHLRTLRIAGTLMSIGVMGLIPLHPAMRGFIPAGAALSPTLVISFAAAAFFGFWTFFDAAMGLFRTVRQAPADPQVADEILRRELARVYSLPVGDLMLKRGMRVFGFLVALLVAAAVCYVH